MISCSIKGCDEFVSEYLSPREIAAKWIIIRACRCGAYNIQEHKSCVCHNDGPIPISYWPNLDWWAFGGVDEVVLCPKHRAEVYREIVGQQINDPSMNSTKQNRGNLH